MAYKRGSHYGSFAKGFIQAFLQAQRLRMQREYYESRIEDARLADLNLGYDRNTGKYWNPASRKFDGDQYQGPPDWKYQAERDAYEEGRKTAGGIGGGSGQGGTYSLQDMVAMAEKAGFKGEDAAHMAALAMAESGGNPGAIGAAGEIGLTQINPHAHPDLVDLAKSGPQGMFDAAYKIYTNAGNKFGDWSTDPTSPHFTPNNNGVAKYFDQAKAAQAALAAQPATTTEKPAPIKDTGAGTGKVTTGGPTATDAEGRPVRVDDDTGRAIDPKTGKPVAAAPPAPKVTSQADTQRPYETAGLDWAGPPSYDQAARLRAHEIQPADMTPEQSAAMRIRPPSDMSDADRARINANARILGLPGAVPPPDTPARMVDMPPMPPGTPPVPGGPPYPPPDPIRSADRGIPYPPPNALPPAPYQPFESGFPTDEPASAPIGVFPTRTPAPAVSTGRTGPAEINVPLAGGQKDERLQPAPVARQAIPPRPGLTYYEPTTGNARQPQPMQYQDPNDPRIYRGPGAVVPTAPRPVARAPTPTLAVTAPQPTSTPASTPDTVPLPPVRPTQASANDTGTPTQAPTQTSYAIPPTPGRDTDDDFAMRAMDRDIDQGFLDMTQASRKGGQVRRPVVALMLGGNPGSAAGDTGGGNNMGYGGGGYGGGGYSYSGAGFTPRSSTPLDPSKAIVYGQIPGVNSISPNQWLANQPTSTMFTPAQRASGNYTAQNVMDAINALSPDQQKYYNTAQGLWSGITSTPGGNAGKQALQYDLSNLTPSAATPPAVAPTPAPAAPAAAAPLAAQPVVTVTNAQTAQTQPGAYNPPNTTAKDNAFTGNPVNYGQGTNYFGPNYNAASFNQNTLPGAATPTTNLLQSGGAVTGSVNDLQLSPQEQYLYDLHLSNLAGPGGVDNPNGSRSTLFQTSAEADGRTYNIPTVRDSRIVSPTEAMTRARQDGLDRYPSYASPEEAEARYQQMHQYMDRDVGQFKRMPRYTGGKIGYDDGGGVSASPLGMLPGTGGGQQQIPPVYFNPQIYSQAGAPINRGVSANTIPSFAAMAVPTYAARKGGGIPSPRSLSRVLPRTMRTMRYAEGGDVDLSDPEGDEVEQQMAYDDRVSPPPSAPVQDTSSQEAALLQQPNEEVYAPDTAPTAQAQPVAYMRPSAGGNFTIPGGTGGMGGPRMSVGAGPRVGIPRGAGRASTDIAPAGAEAEDMDYSTPSAAQPSSAPPPVNDNGDLSPSFLNVLAMGIKNIIGLTQPGAKVPPNSEIAQNRSEVATSRLTEEDHQAAQLLGHHLDQSQSFDNVLKNVNGLNELANYYLVNGEDEKAAHATSAMLMYLSKMSAKYGEEGLRRYWEGNMQGALDALSHAKDFSPDGTRIKGTWDASKGTADVQLTNYRNVVKWEGEVLPQQILAVATNTANRSMFWHAVQSQAAQAGNVQAKEGLTREAQEEGESAIGATGANQPLQPVQGGQGGPGGAPRAIPVQGERPPTPVSTPEGTTPESTAPKPTPAVVQQFNRPPIGETPAPNVGPTPTSTLPSPLASDVAMDRVNAQEQAAERTYVTDIRAKYQTPSGNIIWNGQEYARPTPPDMSGLTASQRKDAYARWKVNQLDPYNAMVAANNHNMTQELAAAKAANSQKFNAIRLAVTEKFSQGQQTERMREQERLHIKKEEARDALDKSNKLFSANLAGSAPLNPTEMNSLVGENKTFDPYIGLARAFNPDLGEDVSRAQAMNDLKQRQPWADANTQRVLAGAYENSVRHSRNTTPDEVGAAIQSYVTGGQFTAHAEAVDEQGRPVARHGVVRYDVTVEDGSGNHLSFRVPVGDLLNLRTARQAYAAAQTNKLGEDVRSQGLLNLPARPGGPTLGSGIPGAPPITTEDWWQGQGAIPGQPMM